MTSSMSERPFISTTAVSLGGKFYNLIIAWYCVVIYLNVGQKPHKVEGDPPDTNILIYWDVSQQQTKDIRSGFVKNACKRRMV